jgi:hypothetical protein
MEDKMLTFFDEVQELLGMLNKAFPAGRDSYTKRNMVTFTDSGQPAIVVWFMSKDGNVESVHMEIEEADKALSFEDIIFELKSYIASV